MKKVREIANKIAKLKKANETFLVAIDGFGGSGKSTLAKDLKNILGNGSEIVPLDDFNYPPDRKRLLDQVLIPLKHDESSKYQRYDWNSKSLTEWIEIKPGRIVIIEGLTALHKELIDNYNLTIWIDMDQDKANKRGISRDLNDYKVDTKKQWKEDWIPMEKEYVDSTKPQSRADIIYKPEE